jgi:cysteine desulfurase
VLHAAASHAATGGPVSVIGVDRLGRVDPAGYAAALTAGDTALAVLQSANHEVGTVQPVTEVAGICAGAVRGRGTAAGPATGGTAAGTGVGAHPGVPLYVDAAQSVGRVPLPDGWSLASASAHKWGGPPGVGLLVVRKGTRWVHPGPADERESGRVPGFGNVPAVVAAAASLHAVLAEAEAEAARLRPLVDRIRAEVPQLVPDVEVVGDPVDRLPHLVTFSCLYVDGEALLTELDRRGFAVSSGSSCTSAAVRPSHVLEAMGVLSHGNVRVSLHRGVTATDVDAFLAALPEVVRGLRESAGVTGL